MNGTWRQQFDRWLLGLTQGCVQGSATAVKAFLGVAAGNAVGLQIPILDLQQAGSVFVFALAWHISDYLSRNPLPSAPSVQINPIETK